MKILLLDASDIANIYTECITSGYKLRPDNAKGIYRDSDDWVMVDYGTTRAQIHRDRYERSGYQPPVIRLPSKEEFQMTQPSLRP